MLTFKERNKKNLKDELYINGYESDGKTITIYFNDNNKMTTDYSKEKITELRKTMRSQYEDAIHHVSGYRADASVDSSSIIGSNFILALLIGGSILLPSFIIPTLLASPVLLGIIYSSYKDMIIKTKYLNAIEKYRYWRNWQHFINGYIFLSFNELTDKEGYEPNYITENDLESYSLEELKEMVEGIKADYDYQFKRKPNKKA